MTSVIHDASSQCLSANVATPTAHRDQRAVGLLKNIMLSALKARTLENTGGPARPAQTALSTILSKNDDAFRRVVRK